MSKLVNSNKTALIRINSGYRTMLKIQAANDETTIRKLVEGYIDDGMTRNNIVRKNMMLTSNITDRIEESNL